MTITFEESASASPGEPFLAFRLLLALFGVSTLALLCAVFVWDGGEYFATDFVVRLLLRTSDVSAFECESFRGDFVLVDLASVVTGCLLGIRTSSRRCRATSSRETLTETCRIVRFAGCGDLLTASSFALRFFTVDEPDGSLASGFGWFADVDASRLSLDTFSFMDDDETVFAGLPISKSKSDESSSSSSLELANRYLKSKFHFYKFGRFYFRCA